MKINKYKYLGNGKYKVEIENRNYILYEDIILKNNILAKEEVLAEDLSKYLKNNNYYEAYYKSLEYINKKLRTEKEIITYLKKYDLSKLEEEEVLNKLKKEGYLNENIYVEAYINDQRNLKQNGPLKIIKDLEKLGINRKVAEVYLKNYPKEEQIEKINRLIMKELKLNNNKSEYVLKNKILLSLINKGFYKEDILNALESVEINETEIYQKEYNKLLQKYSNKYKGKELEYKIKEKLYQKGFRI